MGATLFGRSEEKQGDPIFIFVYFLSEQRQPFPTTIKHKTTTGKDSKVRANNTCELLHLSNGKKLAPSWIL